MKSYYFTERHQATEKEAAEAKKLGYVLINGMFGDTFNRECENVAGNYPAHLKDKAVKRQRAAKSPQQTEKAED